MDRDSSPRIFRRALGLYAVLVGLSLILTYFSC